VSSLKAQIILDSLVVILIALVFIAFFFSRYSSLLPYVVKSGIIVKIKALHDYLSFGEYLVDLGYTCLYSPNITLRCYDFLLPGGVHFFPVGRFVIVFGTRAEHPLFTPTLNKSALSNVPQYCLRALNGTNKTKNKIVQVVSYVYQAGVCYAAYQNGSYQEVPANYCVCQYPSISGTGGITFFNVSEPIEQVTTPLWDEVAKYGFDKHPQLIILGKFFINPACKQQLLYQILYNYTNGKNYTCKNFSRTGQFAFCVAMAILKHCARSSPTFTLYIIPLDENISLFFPLNTKQGNGYILNYNYTVPQYFVLYKNYFAFPSKFNCTVTSQGITCNYTVSSTAIPLIQFSASGAEITVERALLPNKTVAYLCYAPDHCITVKPTKQSKK